MNCSQPRPASQHKEIPNTNQQKSVLSFVNFFQAAVWMKIYLKFYFLSLFEGQGRGRDKTLKNMYKVQRMPISTEEPISMQLKILWLFCGLKGTVTNENIWILCHNHSTFMFSFGNRSWIAAMVWADPDSLSPQGSQGYLGGNWLFHLPSHAT